MEIAGRRSSCGCGSNCVGLTTIYRFEDCELDLGVFEIRRGGESMKVEPQVFDVLAYLVKHRDRVVPKRELLDEIWDDRFVSESALTSRLKAARRAVGDDGRAQRVIRTVHGRGYRFVADVQVVDPASRAGTGPDVTSESSGSIPVGSDKTHVQPETRYAKTGEFSTAYQVAGDGEQDIVFIPGFVSNIELQWELPGFSEFFERLSSFCRLIVFDKRGTGLSDRIPTHEAPTLEERVEDALAVMDAVGSEQATIFGISEGGAMAIMLAAMHPDRVRRLVLCNAYARVDWMTLEELDAGFARLREMWGRGRWYSDFLAPSWGKHDRMRRLLARYERNSATPAAVEQVLRLNVRIDATGVLGSITQPTLVLHRPDDRMIPFTAGKAIAEGIPGAKMVELEGADHLAFAGDADNLLDHVERFVREAEDVAQPTSALRTVVVAEIENAGTLEKKLSPESLSRLLERVHSASDAVAHRHRGRLAKESSDADTAILVFGGPARAVQAAFELRNTVLAQEELRLRIGVHTAQVELDGAEVKGAGVSIARAVASLATPGEVWTSRTVCDLVAGSGLRFDSRDQHRLPGVTEDWMLYAAASPG